MKIILLACLLGISLADHPVSSYSSLPYEGEGQGGGYQTNSIQGGYGYGPQQTYQYATGQQKGHKFGLDLGKIIYTPVRIVKGAGNYVHDLLGDIKGKYLQLTGSLARAKGNFLSDIGEGWYKKGSSYRTYPQHPATFFHKPRPSYAAPQPAYGAPAPVQPKPVYGAPAPAPVPSLGYGAPSVKKMAKTPQSAASFGVPKTSDVVKSAEEPKDQYQAASSVQSYRAPAPAASGRVGHHADFFPSQQVYSYDSQPIPVPVPVKIAPMKLVMPQLPH